LFKDVSELPFPSSSEILCDNLRIVKVRGIILDAKGNPTGHPIESSRVVNNCLLAGTSSVHRSGKIISTSQLDGTRKKSMSVAQQQPSRTPNTTDFVVDDLPITMNCEHLFDWASCKPHHRQGNNNNNFQEGKFSVSVPEHPVTWIFSRKFNDQNFTDQKSSTLYLIEVQYNLKLICGMVIFFLLLLVFNFF
jgi:hypothetical protein